MGPKINPNVTVEDVTPNRKGKRAAAAAAATLQTDVKYTTARPPLATKTPAPSVNNSPSTGPDIPTGPHPDSLNAEVLKTVKTGTTSAQQTLIDNAMNNRSIKVPIHLEMSGSDGKPLHYLGCLKTPEQKGTDLYTVGVWCQATKWQAFVDQVEGTEIEVTDVYLQPVAPMMTLLYWQTVPPNALKLLKQTAEFVRLNQKKQAGEKLTVQQRLSLKLATEGARESGVLGSAGVSTAAASTAGVTTEAKTKMSDS